MDVPVWGRLRHTTVVRPPLPRLSVPMLYDPASERRASIDSRRTRCERTQTGSPTVRCTQSMHEGNDPGLRGSERVGTQWCNGVDHEDPPVPLPPTGVPLCNQRAAGDKYDLLSETTGTLFDYACSSDGVGNRLSYIAFKRSTTCWTLDSGSPICATGMGFPKRMQIGRR